MTSSEFRRTVKVIVGIDGLESSAGDRGNIGRHQLALRQRTESELHPDFAKRLQLGLESAA